ncbi:g8113 [Coccomyxa elongata]
MKVLRNSGILLRSNKRLRSVEEQTSVVKLRSQSCCTFVFALPDELLDDLLPHVDTEDLCSLSQVCRRLNKLAEAPSRWHSLCAERWGPLTELHYAAATLAGSWKKLYRSKHETDKKAEQAQNLCPYEVEAAVQRLRDCAAPSDRSTIATFCVDGSGSMASEDFKVMTNFIHTSMTGLMARDVNCKVAVVQFSNDVRVEVAPQYMPLDELKRQLDEMSRMNGGTNIALAIKQAGQLLKNEDADASRIIILLTDGRVDTFQGREAVKMAERLADEQANVSIFALGVGRGVEKTEMQRIIGVCGADKVALRYIPLCTLDEAPW